jgi:hypothetical protein
MGSGSSGLRRDLRISYEMMASAAVYPSVPLYVKLV